MPVRKKPDYHGLPPEACDYGDGRSACIKVRPTPKKKKVKKRRGQGARKSS